MAVDLKPQTIAAFDRYIAQTDAKMQSRWNGEHFLWFDESAEIREMLLAGEVIAQPIKGSGIVSAPGGLIQDWIGAVFVPKATLKEALTVAEDYPQHTKYYPDITAVKILSHTGNDYLIRTRVVKSKFFISDVLEIDNQIHYVLLDPRRAYSRSESQRVVEISNPGRPDETELPPGHDRGLLWRMNAYWFYEENDGGVFITCESITLTRDVPFLMGRILSPIVREMPADSMKTGLEQTRAAIEDQPRLTAR